MTLMDKNNTRKINTINYITITILFISIAYFSIGYSPEKGYFINTHVRGSRLPLSLSATDVAKWAGERDVGTYIRAAKDYIETGTYEIYVKDLWPPGQVYYIILLIYLTGEQYFPLKYLATSVTMWLVVFMIVTNILSRKRPYIGIPFIVMIPLFFTDIREYIFGYGVLGSQMLTMPLYVLLFFMLLLYNSKHEKKAYQLTIAILLASLAYIRGYFEVFGNFLTFLLILYLAAIFFKRLFLLTVISETKYTFNEIKNILWSRKNQFFGTKIRSITTILIIFMLLLLPWRINNLVRRGSMSWLNIDYYWSHVWKSDDEIHPLFRQSAITNACHTDPTLCKILASYENKNGKENIPYELYYKLTITTFISKPILWYKNKLSFIDTFWFGDSWQKIFESNKRIFFELLIIVFSPMIFYVLYLLKWKDMDSDYKTIYLFSLTFVIFNIVLFSILHFEKRYSIFLKLTFLFMIVLMFHDYILNKIAKRHQS